METAGGTKDQPTGRTVILTDRVFQESPHRLTCASFSRFLRVKRDIVNPSYLFWYLQYLYNQGEMYQYHLQHTGVARFQYTQFATNQRVNIPSSSVQFQIVSTLNTLEDKIELNRRMNETLEAMARAIFKDWFVDFGPTRAKMEGRAPYLAPDIWSLFPDRLDDEGKPEGWQYGKVYDIGKVICGKTPPTNTPKYYGDDLPFITIPDMHSKIFVLTSSKNLSASGAAYQSNKTLPKGAICVSCIATPGLVIITTKPSQTNQQINSVIPSNAEETFYWYWILKNLGEIIRQGGSGGSVLSNLNTSRFSNLDIFGASNKMRRLYHKYAFSFFYRIQANEEESLALIAIRDFLLPKLMSGEIRVKDAEKASEMIL
ncbi:type I restriction enzyme, S subunit [Azospirillaceae bacterium]